MTEKRMERDPPATRMDKSAINERRNADTIRRPDAGVTQEGNNS